MVARVPNLLVLVKVGIGIIISMSGTGGGVLLIVPSVSMPLPLPLPILPVSCYMLLLLRCCLCCCCCCWGPCRLRIRAHTLLLLCRGSRIRAALVTVLDEKDGQHRHIVAYATARHLVDGPLHQLARSALASGVRTKSDLTGNLVVGGGVWC